VHQVGTTSEKSAALPSGTWQSVINRQAETVKKSNSTEDAVPFWAVAEAQEVGS